MVSFASMGQSSFIDSDREYIGWSYIFIRGKHLTIEARDNIASYSNPRITPIFKYKFAKEIPIDYPPLEHCIIYYMSVFYTHISDTNMTKVNIFCKAAKKYFNEMDKTLLGEPSLWSYVLEKYKKT